MHIFTCIFNETDKCKTAKVLWGIKGPLDNTSGISFTYTKFLNLFHDGKKLTTK
jgi:hypothetical protein